MSYLIDTNVLCETIKSSPNKSVVNWFQSIPSDSLYISVLTIGEIRKGVEKLPPSKKKEKILSWLDHTLFEWFEDKILPIDFEVADKWGYILGNSKEKRPVIDSLIAATALTHNLKVVTRNTDDYKIPGVEVINPWRF